MSKPDISKVMNDHVARLMAIEGVSGVAIGETDEKMPCILVLVLEESDEIRSRIPTTLDGHPVRLMVSGKIEPM